MSCKGTNNFIKSFFFSEINLEMQIIEEKEYNELTGAIPSNWAVLIPEYK